MSIKSVTANFSHDIDSEIVYAIIMWLPALEVYHRNSMRSINCNVFESVNANFIFKADFSVMQISHFCRDWKTPGLKGCVQLSWALSLRSVAQIPMALMETMPDTLNCLSFTEALEQDEAVLDLALTGKVFQFLKVSGISIDVILCYVYIGIF